FLAGIREVIKKQGGHGTAGGMGAGVNARIKGWGLDHRPACSKRTFSDVEKRSFCVLLGWGRGRQQQKSRKGIKATYFKRFGNRDWVFTGIRRDGKGKTHPVCLLEAARVAIVRHVKIRGDANQYDPQWEGYFEERLLRKMQSTLAGRGQVYW